MVGFCLCTSVYTRCRTVGMKRGFHLKCGKIDKIIPILSSAIEIFGLKRITRQQIKIQFSTSYI